MMNEMVFSESDLFNEYLEIRESVSIYINLLTTLSIKKYFIQNIISLLQNNFTFQISQRIEEIDNFYEDNFGEPHIIHFEKARIRLKKLLMYNPDIFELASNKNEMKSLYLMNKNK